MDSRARDTQGKKSLHFFKKHSPHGNLGSQYGCIFQCGWHAIRTNGTSGSTFLCAGGAAARIFAGIRSGTTRTDVNL
ncbi:unnamed protein product, partial [Staurois parvus]